MKTIINSKNAPAPVGPYNQAILAGNTLYVSGQIAIDPATGVIITESIEAETEQVLNNLSAVLDEAGMNFEHMPEVKWAFGYPMALVLMILAGGTPYWYFRQKGWLD